MSFKDSGESMDENVNEGVAIGGARWEDTNCHCCNLSHRGKSNGFDTILKKTMNRETIS